jgi:hypothetical protein
VLVKTDLHMAGCDGVSVKRLTRLNWPARAVTEYYRRFVACARICSFICSFISAYVFFWSLVSTASIFLSLSVTIDFAFLAYCIRCPEVSAIDALIRVLRSEMIGVIFVFCSSERFSLLLMRARVLRELASLRLSAARIR